MAQETVKAIDAGSKEVAVSVTADGAFVTFSLPYGSFKIHQKAIEKILADQNDEASKAKVEAKAEAKAEAKK